jgi:hypothetical protein
MPAGEERLFINLALFIFLSLGGEKEGFFRRGAEPLLNSQLSL